MMKHLQQRAAAGLIAAVLYLVTPLGTAGCTATPDSREKGKGVQGAEEFTLTADHVQLLRHLRVVWFRGPVDAWAAGVPAIDLEMPFGSTEIQRDVARILGHPGRYPAAGSSRSSQWSLPDAWMPASWHGVDRLPEGLLQAVAILVDAGKLKPGSYTIVNAMRERIAAGRGLPSNEGANPEIPATPTFRFEVTTDHLKLFPHARFDGFAFNFKRPYGDMTYFYLDVADALGVKRPPLDADGGSSEFAAKEIARFDRLHCEMLFTFQAFLQYAQLEPGVYVPNDDKIWTRRAGPALH